MYQSSWSQPVILPPICQTRLETHALCFPPTPKKCRPQEWRSYLTLLTALHLECSAKWLNQPSVPLDVPIFLQ